MTDTKAPSLEGARRSVRGEGAKLLAWGTQRHDMVRDALVLKSSDPDPSHEKGLEKVLFRISPSAQPLFTTCSAAPCAVSPNRDLGSFHLLLL